MLIVIRGFTTLLVKEIKLTVFVTKIQTRPVVAIGF